MSRRSWKQWSVVALLSLLAGCNSGGSGAVVSAALNTTVALVSAGVSRSQGGCVASCGPGTTCDRNTGYCVVLPCRGQCSANEQCVEQGITSKCVALSLPGQVTVEPSKEAKNEP